MSSECFRYMVKTRQEKWKARMEGMSRERTTSKILKARWRREGLEEDPE